MARYSPIDISPEFVPVDSSRQALPASGEYPRRVTWSTTCGWRQACNMYFHAR
jgi:hypothetical protein